MTATLGVDHDCHLRPHQRHTLAVAYSVDNGGAQTTDTAALRDCGFETNRDVTLSEIVIVLGGEDFCIEAAAATGTYFSVTGRAGATEGSCS